MKPAHAVPVFGFTLIEILLASVAAALILVAIYGVFQHAIALRDSDTQRIRDTRLRLRAADVIRNDLRNAYISGGVLASVVEGDSAGTDGSLSQYPGYLRFTTTGGHDTSDALFGDVAQVDYYIARDTSATDAAAGGDLMRSVTRDLLDTSGTASEEERILTGVESFQVSFYDGANWQTSWSYVSSTTSATAASSSSASTSGSSSSAASTSGTQTLPLAIRVDIQQEPATPQSSPPVPIEVMVPWTMVPFSSPTPSPTATP